MRLIDADKIPFKLGFDTDEISPMDYVRRHYIDQMPTIDAVQVVRCMDCKWWSVDPEYCWDGETELPQRLCWVHDSYVEANDFCSKGVRREDNV